VSLLLLKRSCRCSLEQDLDPALTSRFSTSINFGLPSEKCRLDAVCGETCSTTASCCGLCVLVVV
jgi:hypothetical protein